MALTPPSIIYHGSLFPSVGPSSVGQQNTPQNTREINITIVKMFHIHFILQIPSLL